MLTETIQNISETESPSPFSTLTIESLIEQLRHLWCNKDNGEGGGKDTNMWTLMHGRHAIGNVHQRATRQRATQDQCSQYPVVHRRSRQPESEHAVEHGCWRFSMSGSDESATLTNRVTGFLGRRRRDQLDWRTRQGQLWREKGQGQGRGQGKSHSWLQRQPSFLPLTSNKKRNNVLDVPPDVLQATADVRRPACPLEDYRRNLRSPIRRWGVYVVGDDDKNTT